MKKTVLRNDRAFDELKSELYKRLNRISDQSARDNLWEIISYMTNNYSGSPSNPYIADIDNELLSTIDSYIENMRANAKVFSNVGEFTEIEQRNAAEYNRQAFFNLQTVVIDLIHQRLNMGDFQKVTKFQRLFMSEEEREKYDSTITKYESDKNKRELGEYVVLLELKRMNLEYENKILQEKREKLFEMWGDDEDENLNAATYSARLEAIDSAIKSNQAAMLNLIQTVANSDFARSLFERDEINRMILEKKFDGSKLRTIINDMAKCVADAIEQINLNQRDINRSRSRIDSMNEATIGATASAVGGYLDERNKRIDAGVSESVSSVGAKYLDEMKNRKSEKNDKK